MPLKKESDSTAKFKEEEIVVSNLEKSDLTSSGKAIDISMENEDIQHSNDGPVLFLFCFFLFHVHNGYFKNYSTLFFLLWPCNLFDYY